MRSGLKPDLWTASLPVAVEGAGVAIPVTLCSVGLLYAHIHVDWILPGIVASLLGMVLMQWLGAKSARPMVYSVRMLEVATLINFLDIFIEKMPSWGLQNSPEHRLMLVMMVSVCVAILLPLCHVLRFAQLARLIPLPVFAGFANAICISILFSQSKVIAALIKQHEWPLIALIVATVLTAIASHHYIRRIPAGVAGLLVGSIAGYLFQVLGHNPLPMIGSFQLSFTLPVMMVPWQDLWASGVDVAAVLRNVFFASIVVTLVCFLNTVIAESFMNQLDGMRSSHRDWKSLSVAQFLAIAVGCTPLTPSVSASRAAAMVGPLTKQALVMMGVISLLVFGTGVLGFVPVAAIAGALLFEAWSSFHRPSLQLSWQFLLQKNPLHSVQKEDLLLVWLVVLAAVFYNMIFGVLVGVMGGLVLYAIRNGRRMIRSIRTGENIHSNCVWSATEADLLRLHGKTTRMVALDGALFFGIADALQLALKEQLQQSKRFIVDWTLVNSLDSAVANSVGNIVIMAQSMGVKVAFCGLEAAGQDIENVLAVSFTLPLVFPDVDRALEWAEVDVLQEHAADASLTKGLGLESIASLFGIDQQDFELLRSAMELRSYRQGDVVFQRGDLGSDMVIILQGAADVRFKGHNDRDVRVALYRQGAIVGEMGFLDGKPRSATVTAVSDLQVAVLNRSAFDAYSVDSPAGARQILMHLAMELNSRLRRTNRIL